MHPWEEVQQQPRLLFLPLLVVMPLKADIGKPEVVLGSRLDRIAFKAACSIHLGDNPQLGFCRLLNTHVINQPWAQKSHPKPASHRQLPRVCAASGDLDG